MDKSEIDFLDEPVLIGRGNTVVVYQVGTVKQKPELEVVVTATEKLTEIPDSGYVTIDSLIKFSPDEDWRFRKKR